MLQRIWIAVLVMGSTCLSVDCVVNADQIADQQIQDAVQPFVDRQELAGAVMLVANADDILSVTAVGDAHREKNQKMATNAIFWIASQSKPMTAVSLMMLVDEGKISVNDPVDKYLPEFRGQMVVAERDENRCLLVKPSQPITIANLLSHTSGLPFRSNLEVLTLDHLPLADRVRSYAMTPLDYHPGSEYRYSNAGINTAARIIEVVSGEPFHEFISKRLFEPLGMVDTTFWPDDQQVARLAVSYRPGEGGEGLQATTVDQLRYPLTNRRDRYAMPAGGLFSTANDLSRFYRMLAGGGHFDGKDYLSAASVEALTSKQTPDKLASQYGFGFSTGGNRFGHGGAYSTNSYYDRDHGLIFVWLVQHAGFPGKGGQSQEAFRQAAISALGRP